MKEKVAEGVNIILLFITIRMMVAAPKRQQLRITSVEEQVEGNDEDHQANKNRGASCRWS